MKNPLFCSHVTVFIAASVLLIGCATEPVPVPVHQETAEERAQKELNARTEANAPAQAALNEGVDLYNKGAFPAAIKHLTDAGVIWSGDKVIQVEAYKYLAFSYCVTSRQALCKQQFEKALKLDPTFELGRGEKGHPLWGPVFEKAKNTK
jgi:tetratricopeptide (TPR) repeat protein